MTDRVLRKLFGRLRGYRDPVPVPSDLARLVL